MPRNWNFRHLPGIKLGPRAQCADVTSRLNSSPRPRRRYPTDDPRAPSAHPGLETGQPVTTMDILTGYPCAIDSMQPGARRLGSGGLSLHSPIAVFADYP